VDDRSRKLTDRQREAVLAHVYALEYSYAEERGEVTVTRDSVKLCLDFFACFSQTCNPLGGEWSLFEDFKQ
jgi:hypothetical protein